MRFKHGFTLTSKEQVGQLKAFFEGTVQGAPTPDSWEYYQGLVYEGADIRILRRACMIEASPCTACSFQQLRPKTSWILSPGRQHEACMGMVMNSFMSDVVMSLHKLCADAASRVMIMYDNQRPRGTDANSANESGSQSRSRYYRGSTEEAHLLQSPC